MVFALYAITLGPTTAFWDTSEYIATAEIMGIPHPPGNPLFVVLARAWSILLTPLGLSAAVKVNLFSALMSATAHGLWFLVVHHVLRYFSEDRLFRFALRMLGDEGRAADVLQEAYRGQAQGRRHDLVLTRAEDLARRPALRFDREIVAIPGPDGSEISKDDGPRRDGGDMREKLGQLGEAFEGGGGVTAGNSCPLNDGAAAVLVMSDTKAKELGLSPRARIITAATEGNNPELMGVAPIGAIKKVLGRAGMTISDVDAVELNEAFAAQVIPIMEECGIPLEKLNTHGGAIALGHPFGMTGARIMGTLLNVMETDDHQVGLETMCVAGGQGEAMIVERV